jgi:adenosylhomocysteine nucleosidase
VATELTEPWVLFALEREAAPFRRLGIPGVRIGVTGVGARAARAAVRRLFAAGTPGPVVMAGFAGALRPGLAVGDVLRPAEVVDGAGRCWPAAPPWADTGRLLTVHRLVGEPAAKVELGRRHGADIVDMESAAVADECAWHGIPFAAVRAVSDDAATRLPPALAGVLASGRVRPFRLAKVLLRQPWLASHLWRLARDTRKAAEALAEALAELTGPGVRAA